MPFRVEGQDEGVIAMRYFIIDPLTPTLSRREREYTGRQ
jgi:hypothetical protein